MKLITAIILAASMNGYAQDYMPCDIALHDGFESGRLASFWRPGTNLYNESDVVIQRKVTRSGRYAAEINLNPGDVAQKDGNHMSERTELSSGKQQLLGREIWNGFSLYLPKSFPLVKNRLVLMSWKQTAPPPDNPSPVVALRYEEGQLFATVRVPKQVARIDIHGFNLGQ